MTKSQKFEIAFTQIIGEEGGYVNDPRDPGGETKYGIAKKYHPKEDIKNLSLARAKEIYFQGYWAPANVEALDLPLALVFFDALVNMGNSTATKLMQEALGEVPDGVIGPRTRSAMIRQGQDLELIVKYQAERGLYYASRGHFDRFGRGWLRRIIRTAMQAVELGAAS